MNRLNHLKHFTVHEAYRVTTFRFSDLIAMIKARLRSSKRGSRPVEPAQTATACSKSRARSAALKIEYSDGPRREMGETSLSWVPENWKEMLENIRKMRRTIEAPVDTMGCDKCPDQSVPQKLVRYQLLVSLMLSSQTKDEVTHAAVGRLREFTLTPESIAGADEKQIEQLIYPVSFYKATKAKVPRKKCDRHVSSIITSFGTTL